MRKMIIALTAATLLVSGCGTYTGQGAYVGGSFGSVLGSAIGGISGGRHGSHVGTIIGMAGGAAVGAAVGAAADQKQQERYEDYRRQRDQQYNNYDNSGYDGSNRGDDRIDFDAPGPRGNQDYTAATPHSYSPSQNTMEQGYSFHVNELIEIRNARIIDSTPDGILRAGEEMKVTFEIMNNSSKDIFDVQPMVFDATSNKNIHISPSLHVECIPPHSGIRYTASILAGRKLKDGEIIVRIGVIQGNREVTSQMQEFRVVTRRK